MCRTSDGHVCIDILRIQILCDVHTADPVYHTNGVISGGSNTNKGARTMILSGIAYATAGATTGAYISFSGVMQLIPAPESSPFCFYCEAYVLSDVDVTHDSCLHRSLMQTLILP